VRDLLLGREAKDYDIATGARPQQVKRTFPRNCRIIGRRFKLAHLHFHDNTKILEVSTFRRSPQIENQGADDDLLITRDNEFGNAEEDALRRDFTVNALFLDPTRDRILDYTNGLADLRARVIRTIGDPHVRFREDPVRILRAAKFAGRLGFQIEPETFAAMAETSCDLVRAAPPRLLEEILRLLRGGHALDSFMLLRDVGALKSLVPVLAEFLATARHDQRVDFWRLLEALDHRVADTGRVPQNAVLLGVLLVCPVLAKVELNPGRSPSSIAEELLGPLGQSLRLPRRDAGCLKRICGVQHRFVTADSAKRFRVAGFVHGPYFEEALELFELRMLGHEDGAEALHRWQEIAASMGRHAAADHEYRDHDDDESRGEAEQAGEESGEDRGDPEVTPADHEDHGHDGDAPTAAPGRIGRSQSRGAPARAPAPPDAGADDDAPRWPTHADDSADTGAGHAAADAEGDAGDGSPRRRRRRRRRGRRDRDDDAPAAAAPDSADAPTGDGADDDARPDAATPTAPRSRPQPAPPRSDFAHPEGAEPDGDETADTGHTADEAPTADGTEQDATEQADEPGRRRRRRRRRRRGNRQGDERFPASEAPAPHGEATDATAGGHEPLVAADVRRDPDAPLPDGDNEPLPPDLDADAGPEADLGEDDGEGTEIAGDGIAEGEADDEGGEPADGEAVDDEAVATDGAPGDERRGRRRRRRGRRGRRRDGDAAGDGGEGDRPRGQPQQVQQAQRQQHAPRQQPKQKQPQHQQQPQQQQQPQRQQQQHGQQGSRHDRQRERRERRRDGRGGHGGHGAPRDVDIVPRYRDRRGKVDVIEPAPLDLSAFDVELDPKRVPTFGSIVEGKGRPKKRAPRVPDDGVDDYRPPPPPGSDPSPAPPPPPPTDTPDTFGDW
jgi:poly(A) polymerase